MCARFFSVSQQRNVFEPVCLHVVSIPLHSVNVWEISKFMMLIMMEKKTTEFGGTTLACLCVKCTPKMSPITSFHEINGWLNWCLVFFLVSFRELIRQEFELNVRFNLIQMHRFKFWISTKNSSQKWRY